MKEFKIITLAVALTLILSLVGSPTPARAQATTSALSDETNIYTPFIIDHVQNNAVYGEEWPIGIRVTLTIDNPANGIGVDYTASEVPSKKNEEGPNVAGVAFSLDKAFTLTPDMIVVLTNGNITKEHIVSPLSISETDIATDKVSGVAHLSSEVWVVCYAGDQRVNRHVTTDSAGHWVADFSVAGPTFDEQTTCDIQMDSQGFAIDGGGDLQNDFTKADWLGPHASNSSLISWPFDANDGQWAIINGYRGDVDHRNYAMFALDFAKCQPDKILTLDGLCDLSNGWLRSTGADVISPVTGILFSIDSSKDCAGFALSIDDAPGYYIRLYHIDLVKKLPNGETLQAGKTHITQGLRIGSVSDRNCAAGGTGGHIHMVLYQQTNPDKKDVPETRIGIPFTDRWLIGECSYPDDQPAIANRYKGQLVPCP